jgi:hypothetical protein
VSERLCADKRYFHGTLTRLVTGELLLPPETTKVLCCSTVDSCYTGHRRDRVYFTTNYGEAVTYALTKIQKLDALQRARRYAGRGWVYEVEPIGLIEKDDDYNLDFKDFGEFMCAPKARLIAEYRPSWDRVGFRCLRQTIEDQNGVSLYNDSWPRSSDEFMEVFRAKRL